MKKAFFYNFLILFLLNSLALVILVSLISYDPKIPSLIYNTSNALNNLSVFEKIQSNIAGFFLYFFGFSSYLFVPGIFFLSLFLTNTISYKNLDRLISLIFVILSLSALFNYYSFEIYPNIYPGGYIGSSVLNFLFSIFEQSHAVAFLVVFIFSLMIIIYRFSFIKIFIPVSQVVNYFAYHVASFGMVAFNKIFIQMKGLSISLFDRLTKNEEDDVDLQDIFDDPFWELYFDEHEVVEKKSENTIFQKNPVDENYILPNEDLFDFSPKEKDDLNVKKENERRADTLERKLENFGIKGKVISITHGPLVTLFEYQPSVDTKVSNIVAREDDLALALEAVSLRIIAPIPGKSVVGFEVARVNRKSVLYSELVLSDKFIKFTGELPLILGKSVLGHDYIIDLASMPHLLVAGATGSGKSVGLNCMLMSLICKKTPDDLRLILIDPKRLEFASYADIPHLVFPIITEPARAVLVLKWVVKTMEERYSKMANFGVKNVYEFNNLDKTIEERMPRIVIIIDELADLMMTGGKDVEHSIARLAQMSRAAGIHLIIATQRPSVDVITGLIKVNFPSRISYRVTSKIDSRTILDSQGAEKLLGRGDMLFLDGKGVLNRVHGAYVSDVERKSVIEFIKEQRSPKYESFSFATKIADNENKDELYDEIIKFVSEQDEVSISLLQRVFKIGYNRSARVIDQLESDGFILPADGSKKRKVIKEKH